MFKSRARVGWTLSISAACLLLVMAASASAATFKTATGSIALSGGFKSALSKAHVKPSTNTIRLLAGLTNIDMTNGLASGLGPTGSLTLKGPKTATLSGFTIRGMTLTARLGGQTLTFPLSSPNASHDPGFTAESVSGMNVALTGADANALNRALGLSGKKKGAPIMASAKKKKKKSKKGKKPKHGTALKAGTLGTLAYNGNDRQLYETGGYSLLCNDPGQTSTTHKEAVDDGINITVVQPGVLVGQGTSDPNDCAASGPFGGGKFPAAVSGVLDSVTGNGHVDFQGGEMLTKGSITTSFVNATVVYNNGWGGPAILHVSASGFGGLDIGNVGATTVTRNLTATGGTITVTNAPVNITSTAATLIDSTFNVQQGSAGYVNGGDLIGPSSTVVNVR